MTCWETVLILDFWSDSLASNPSQLQASAPSVYILETEKQLDVFWIDTQVLASAPELKKIAHMIDIYYCIPGSVVDIFNIVEDYTLFLTVYQLCICVDLQA